MIATYHSCGTNRRTAGTSERADFYGGMTDDRPVALALVTQTQLDMLGSSLKVVFRIEDSAEGFADLLRALDEADRAGGDRGAQPAV